MNIEPAVRENLTKTIHMSLGTVHDNKPWVCEVHFAWDDNLNLYFSSLSSTRHCQEIAANPNVSGNIVRQHAEGEMPMGLYFEGQAHLVEDEAELAEAFAALDGRFGLGDKALEGAKQPDGRRFYKIKVGTFYIFGALEGPKPQKYELKWSGRQA